MLLRRITQHVKDQNWFAVGLDFVIVVVGVFIGIQVANWNTTRVEIKAEQTLLVRLYEEVKYARQRDQGYQKQFLDSAIADLSIARQVVFNQSDREMLNDRECEAVATSHFPIAVAVSMPTLNQLRVSGEITLFRDKKVVDAIIKVMDKIDAVTLLNDELRPNRVILSKQFPQLITMELKADDSFIPSEDIDGYDPVFSCNSQAMRGDAKFRNFFGENVTSQMFFLEQGVFPLRSSLAEFEIVLGDAVGVE